MNEMLAESVLSETVVYGLQGTGGCARGIMPLLDEGPLEGRSALRVNRLFVFVEPNPKNSVVNGVPVLSDADFISMTCFRKFFNVGIAQSSIRELVFRRYSGLGLETFAIAASTSKVFENTRIAEGSVLCPNTTVTSNATIGRMFHLNINSYVEHDCVIGDFVTFAPGVKCNGNVQIEDHAYIGSGAVIKQGTPDKRLVIGRGAIVGMGAVVTKDVPPATTVVGNPARPISA